MLGLGVNVMTLGGLAVAAGDIVDAAIIFTDVIRRKLGENAALNIIEARNEEDFFSIEDLQIRAKLSGTVIEILRKNGVLDGLSDTDQISFF
jgi:DNA polymerase-3 subunit alpha (Gram-positive type)